MPTSGSPSTWCGCARNCGARRASRSACRGSATRCRRPPATMSIGSTPRRCWWTAWRSSCATIP
eukprot:12710761-Alexandrium_andersonii.AAC.1